VVAFEEGEKLLAPVGNRNPRTIQFFVRSESRLISRPVELTERCCRPLEVVCCRQPKLTLSPQAAHSQSLADE
jgi:hypothetical protein